MLRCGYCSALISEFAMSDLVDRILNTYQLMRPLDADRVSDSRQKITRYIESLASAGQSDAQQWAEAACMRICARSFSAGTTKAPFLDHLDHRININKSQTDN